MSDSEEELLCSNEECQKRSEQFAEITATDTIMAMYYLRPVQWNVQRAILKFYAEHPPSEEVGSMLRAAVVEEERAASSKTEKLELPVTPRRIKVLSWNIDSLDENNLRNRSTYACKEIIKEDADVVFLQEVILLTLDLLREKCPGYFVFGEAKESLGYFVAIMLKKSTVTLGSYDCHRFNSSRMGRHVLSADVTVCGMPFFIMATHLESTRECSSERQKQLKFCFEKLNQVDKGKTVLFGGDLNLRDRDIAIINGPPSGCLDVWECTGKRPEAKYTWNPALNDNLGVPSHFAKCRFDRLYLRNADQPKVKPVYFELAGLEREPRCNRFISDHWAILAHFDIL